MSFNNILVPSVLFKDDDMERHLVFGEDAEVQVELPLGPDWDDFMMDVYVRIYDSQNAYHTLKIDTAQVVCRTNFLQKGFHHKHLPVLQTQMLVWMFLLLYRQPVVMKVPFCV